MREPSCAVALVSAMRVVGAAETWDSSATRLIRNVAVCSSPCSALLAAVAVRRWIARW